MKKKCNNQEKKLNKKNFQQKLILNSISHIVCKFQKDWLINKKKPSLATAPLMNAKFHFQDPAILAFTEVFLDLSNYINNHFQGRKIKINSAPYFHLVFFIKSQDFFFVKFGPYIDLLKTPR